MNTNSLKHHVRILLPVWNKQYIDTFLRLGLPSLLAPGNLPSLVKACDVEFVFLSQGVYRSYIYSNNAVQQLMGLCNVGFIEIDDLIVPKIKLGDLYGYTLTFAFMRGIQTVGKEMINTHFVLLVSDLVYADGALGSFIRYINEGRSVIISAGIRVRRYETAKELCNPSYRLDNCIAISPRQLMKIALENLHPSLLAKMVNKPGLYFKNYQHFFWSVDKDTVIGRNFLAHPLCFKPERYLDMIEGFCDYAFIPEFCPGLNAEQDIVYLNDSDDFAAVELQSSQHELCFCRFGRRDMQRAVHYLSEWATKEHRIFAAHNFFFHAKELPVNTGKYTAMADDYIKQIQIELSVTEPAPASNNPHWLIAIEHFRSLYKESSKNTRQEESQLKLKPPSLDEFMSVLRPAGKIPTLRIGGFYGSELLTIFLLTIADRDKGFAAFYYQFIDVGCRIKNLFDQAFAISFHNYDKLRSALQKHHS